MHLTTPLRLAPLVASIALLAGAGAASGQLIAVEQDRFIRTVAHASQCGGEFQIDEREAPDFGPFTARLDTEHGCEGGLAESAAAQRSMMTSSMFSAAGGGRIAGFGPNFGVVHAFAHSTVDFVFDVQSPVTISIEGILTARRDSDIIGARASISIAPLNAQPVFLRDVEGDAGGSRVTERFSERLTLQPARYRLYVTADCIMDNSIPPDRTADAAFRLSVNVVGN